MSETDRTEFCMGVSVADASEEDIDRMTRPLLSEWRETKFECSQEVFENLAVGMQKGRKKK